MIRVLQMIGTLGLGGSQSMLMNLYRSIDRSRFQFDFVLDHPDGLYFAEEVKALVQARVEAKKAKDFAEADRLRDAVLAMGYIIEDTPKGPRVKRK